ncbi:hypothetical protein SS50377_28592 [Spironucleus salmonicida]|uniref:Uncharacterized protein n=1 Tax=Spironucleus salmonicida TaxID=348837 RepID=V6LAV5_9EUKA|nr:hypothetical protein SS50377_28592 [Spironucleus salmonicida]|eukprot:EST41585.1 Hypothetical protein SS50377_18926 [Spironucleus salmonicida]
MKKQFKSPSEHFTFGESACNLGVLFQNTTKYTQSPPQPLKQKQKSCLYAPTANPILRGNFTSSCSFSLKLDVHAITSNKSTILNDEKANFNLFTARNAQRSGSLPRRKVYSETRVNLADFVVPEEIVVGDFREQLKGFDFRFLEEEEYM